MSIHQSKGLEFPVVVVADLGKRFNFRDGTADIILSEKFGMCGKVKPPGLGRAYPSLSYWLAQRQQRLDTLGEELRLLYVAMTRAEQRLILVGSVGQKKMDEGWLELAGRGLGPAELAAARTSLDWIGSWLARERANFSSGANELLSWKICDDGAGEIEDSKTARAREELSADALEKLRTRLDWSYQHVPATTRSAKTSVSALRKELSDEEAQPFLKFNRANKTARVRVGAKKLSAAEVGSAHHAFLERVALERISDVASLRAEGKRLVSEGNLSTDELAHLDFEALAQFWQSTVGREIVCNSKLVKRELPFTARFAAADFHDIAPEFAPPTEEFVVIQGVVDLAVVSQNEMWILDFKTDHVSNGDVDGKVAQYRPQLLLYARALERIYGRSVTKRWLHFLSAAQTVAV
jgi:ATP-dependent helicase/nuclease subunit A